VDVKLLGFFFGASRRFWKQVQIMQLVVPKRHPKWNIWFDPTEWVTKKHVLFFGGFDTGGPDLQGLV
jgi:hypothetical protein